VIIDEEVTSVKSTIIQEVKAKLSGWLSGILGSKIAGVQMSQSGNKDIINLAFVGADYHVKIHPQSTVIGTTGGATCDKINNC